jgi:sugar/nucleoside kinase (ribokinase family)
LHLPPALPLEIDYLAIGHPTIDEGTPQGDVIGGTVLDASVQAARLGWRAGLVGRGNAGELAPLLTAVAGEVTATLQPADHTTRFLNVSVGDQRTQWVRALAPPLDLTPAGVAGGSAGSAGERGPVRARVLHVAPVAQEVDLGRAAAVVEADIVGVTPQGLIRRWGEDGRVVHVPLALAAVRAEATERLDVVVVADEERPFVEALTRAVRRQGGLVVVTKGSQGCLIETAAGGQMVTALPVVGAVDRTGAGDVFAAGLLVGLAEGRAVAAAVRFAMAAASCSIEGVGPAAVAPRAAIERRLAAAPRA